MQTIILPELGENMTSGQIISVHVAEGEIIEQGQTILEVETEKVVVEVPSRQSGTVTKILIKEGDKVESGQALFELKENTESQKAVNDNVAAIHTSTHQPTPKMPEKKSSEQISPLNSATGEMFFATSKQTAAEGARSTEIGDRNAVRASPLARKIARQLGVDLCDVRGSGFHSRITKKDIFDFVKDINRKLKKDQYGSVGESVRPLPDFSKFGDFEVINCNGIQRATSKNMARTWREVPHAWVQAKVDMTSIEAFRQQHKDRIKMEGGSLTITAILAKMVAFALKEVPILNSSFDATNEKILVKDYFNIGIAVDTKNGLVVPVIKDVDLKSISEIAIDLKELSIKAKSRSLKASDFEGGTFSISNLGGLGASGLMPIINWPETAILGVAASETVAKYVEGQWTPRSVMNLTVGFDHRVINGADTARFLNVIKKVAEDPLAALFKL